jgi:ABC-2 type transport system permease protein
MMAVYLLTLRQLAGRWRLAIMTVLALLPVVSAFLIITEPTAPSLSEFETVVFSAMLAGSIGPLIVLAIAAAAFANEIEDRTIANLTLAPIPRWQIVLPKMFATFTLAAPFIGGSAFATSYITFLGDLTAVTAVTAASLIGVALYAAAFVWLGLVSTQAIGIGLLYIVLWEGLFSSFVSGVRLFSIRHYWIALTHGLDERRFAELDHLSLLAVSIVAAVVLAGFTLLAIRRLRRMDIP